LESTCTNWGYTRAAEEPAEYPAGATEEQKQVLKRFENMRCFVLSQVVQSECLMFGIFDAFVANSAVIVIDYLSTFASCHAGSSQICHSCQSALVQGPRPDAWTGAHAEVLGDQTLEPAWCASGGNHTLRLSFCQ